MLLHKRIFALTIATVILMFQAFPAFAVDEVQVAGGNGSLYEPMDFGSLASPGDLPQQGADGLESCETTEELMELLLRNDGGTITLTGDIIWDVEESFEIDWPTTIEMGEYSITIALSTLSISGPVSFVGEGVNAPLFYIDQEGLLELEGVSITDTGDGACAVWLGQGGSLSGFDNKIVASGVNSTAIEAEDDLHLALCKVDAPNGAAIKGQGDVSLFLCQITGQVASIEAQGDVMLDHTTTEPFPPGAQQMDSIIRLSEYDMDYYILQGESFDAPSAMAFDRFDPEDEAGNAYDWRPLPVDFELTGYDADVAGLYEIAYRVTSHFQDIELNGTVMLHVIDPTLPYIRASLLDEDGYMLLLTQDGWADASDVEVLYSIDAGTSWHDASSDLSVKITDITVDIYVPDIQQIYWFRVVVSGGRLAGTSNIAKSWYAPLSDGGIDPVDNRQLPPDHSAQEPGPIMLAEELMELLAENDGGDVYLTGHVAFQDVGSMWVENPTTVHMGDFSITVPGFEAQTYIDGPIHFVGNGDLHPLFRVRKRGILIFGGRSTITAEKNSAVAIYGEGDVYVEQPEIYAPNGTAVYAKGMASLLYGYISGATSVVSDSNRILLESMITIPAPEDAYVMENIVIPYYYNELEQYGIRIDPGEDYPIEEVLQSAHFCFFDKANPSMEYYTGIYFPLELQMGGDVDIYTPGEYMLTLTPSTSDKRMQVEGLGVTNVPLFVVDPSKPFIDSKRISTDGTMEILFYRGIEEYQELTLWCSSDQGETWTDAREVFANMEIEEYFAALYLSDEQYANVTQYSFKLEVLGGPKEGVSNVLQIFDSPFRFDPNQEDIGGDRIGTDRFPDIFGDAGGGEGGGGSQTGPPTQNENDIADETLQQLNAQVPEDKYEKLDSLDALYSEFGTEKQRKDKETVKKNKTPGEQPENDVVQPDAVAPPSASVEKEESHAPSQPLELQPNPEAEPAKQPTIAKPGGGVYTAIVVTAIIAVGAIGLLIVINRWQMVRKK